jgi:hypothetical protein
MSIFVIADLHLSFGTNKPMDIFGENWENHDKKIADNWIKKVNEKDLVILPGDFSWAMNLEDTIDDFKYLNSLPGKKLLLKGNHDYWWNTLTKMRNYLKQNKFENIDFIQNNYYEYENIIITGTRGWIINGKEEDMKILRREKLRLEMELEAIIKQYGKEKEIIVFMHYPPYEKQNGKIEAPFAEILEKYNVKQCYYGHLHGEQSYSNIDNFIYNNVEYKLISADYLNFDLEKIV